MIHNQRKQRKSTVTFSFCSKGQKTRPINSPSDRWQLVTNNIILQLNSMLKIFLVKNGQHSHRILVSQFISTAYFGQLDQSLVRRPSLDPRVGVHTCKNAELQSLESIQQPWNSPDEVFCIIWVYNCQQTSDFECRQNGEKSTIVRLHILPS